MDSQSDSDLEFDSIKELQRLQYQRKKSSEFAANRKIFKRIKTVNKNKKEKQNKNLNKNHNDFKFKPHFGLQSIKSTTFAFEALAKFANIDIPDSIYKEIEGISLLIVNLTQQVTTLGVVTSVLSWVQSRLSGSLLKKVSSYIIDILQGPQDSLTPEWLDCMRDMKQNWSLCKTSKAFKQISKLIGCLVTLGLCNASALTFRLGSFKLFEPDLWDRHLSAFDVVDAIFETVVYFVEGAYLCFQRRSLRPLLINDKSAMELDVEYAQVIALFELVQNGNLKKFTELSDQEFERRLNRLATSLCNLSQSLRGPEKKVLMDKYQKILCMQNDYVAMKIASGVRHAPWAIELYGESSQGKTTLGDQLIDAVLLSQGLPLDKEYRCAYNAGDKFMSNWTSDKLVMIFDDVSNDKSSFVERPPTRAILDVINNQMFYAPKAEIDAKGKCFVEPWIAVATTNKKDLDAGLYSNCPYSIQRRMTCLTVRAKPEFQRIDDGTYCGIDSSKVRAFYTKDGVYTPPMFDDIWAITIERAVKPEQLRTVASYAPICWHGKEMVNISMSTCIQWAIEDFDEHMKNQEALLDGMRQRSIKMSLCPFVGCKHLKGNCPYHLEEQLGTEFLGVCRNVVESIHGSIENISLSALYNTGMDVIDRWDWITCVPTFAFNTSYMRSLLEFMHISTLFNRFWRGSIVILTAQLLLTFIGYRFLDPLIANCLCIALLGESISCHVQLYTMVKDNFYIEMRDRNLRISDIARRYRDIYAKNICAVSLGLAAIYGVARAYRAYKSGDTQGSLEPKDVQDIMDRDQEINVWTTISKRTLPIDDISKRMSSEQLSNVVDKALLYGSIHLDDGQNGMVNGLMISSNLMIIPNHYFTAFGDDLKCTFRKKNPNASGGKFATRIHINATYLIPHTDLRVCYVPNGGSFKNILHYFPLSAMPSVPFIMRWRRKDGSVLVAKGLTQPGTVTTVLSFKGGRYKNLTMDTFEGLCGATLISDTQGSTIVGLHLGGTAGTTQGCYGSVYQSELLDAIEFLRNVEGVVLTGAAGVFRTEVMGVQVLNPKPLHPKSPLNYLPEHSQIEYFGSCPGRSVMKSSVKVTPISELITDICGVPNIYCAPKFQPEWYGWQTTLHNLAVPGLPFPHDVLQLAIRDYKSTLIPIFLNSLWSGTHKLNDHDNLCGIPGCKFIDAIKLNTSVGFPLKGPKRLFVDELLPTEEWPNNRKLHDALMDEIHYMEDCYRRGVRGYPIAKACKKDEILTKSKCRIFYGNALSLTFLIRKYYLPILRVLQMNPLVSECAVGINCHGPEWDQMYKYVIKYGEDRLFGGDYGKYDQKLPSQTIIAALRILIDCAKECDYTDEDISIMEAMVGDIVFAYIAFNGDLIGLTEGTHISGNSLTVIINGLCGSLNLRTFFYTMYKPKTFEQRIKFRDAVAIMTYGDDNIGSVAPGYDLMTIKNCSIFLESYGQVYTMPDKDSELLDYLPKEQFEFLKRKSVFHEDLGCFVGALLDKSIYKSLHCFMRDKNSVDTEDTACAINIDGALREWFNHGECKYEVQRALMQSVAQRSGIDHICETLNETYSDKVAIWKANYGPRRCP